MIRAHEVLLHSPSRQRQVVTRMLTGTAGAPWLRPGIALRGGGVFPPIASNACPRCSAGKAPGLPWCAAAMSWRRRAGRRNESLSRHERPDIQLSWGHLGPPRFGRWCRLGAHSVP